MKPQKGEVQLDDDLACLSVKKVFCFVSHLLKVMYLEIGKKTLLVLHELHKGKNVSNLKLHHWR